MRFSEKHFSLFLLALACPAIGFAHDVYTLPTLVVDGAGTPLIGVSDTASEGVYGMQDWTTRPTLRTAEFLELVPGMIVTQHSGSGKANQYFLGGFNLDHGTDFATYVDGMPVNLPTHAHGHGYMDLNFVIPELVQTMQYYKRPFRASCGDFSSAGSAYLYTVDRLVEPFINVTIGQGNYLRTVLATSAATANSDFIGAFEFNSNDGPWDTPEHLRKYNGLFKWRRSVFDNGDLRLTLMTYKSSWNSTDQIPERAVNEGLVGRYGALDDTDGGESERYSIAAQFDNVTAAGVNSAHLYAFVYKLNLWSNFTYFLDDEDNGDQFEQSDERSVIGGSFAHTWLLHNDEGFHRQHTAGIDFRFDNIPCVGLYHTEAREKLNTVREDSVRELNVGTFYEYLHQFTDKFRAVAGIRGDYYHFNVDSNIAENSGTRDSAILSPKLELVYRVLPEVELYADAGLGFHSNDARGATIRVDPSDGVTAVDSVDPLVRSKAAELGMRFSTGPRLVTSVSLWWLHMDSEMLFVGDAGTTEASRPSTRTGIEGALSWRSSDWLTLDASMAFTSPRFSDDDPAGNDIPGAIRTVGSAGVKIGRSYGIYGSFRARYFGPRPLIEDGSVEADSTMIFNARIGYVAKKFDVALDCLNVFDSEDYDIAYYYASRLSGESAGGVEDIFFHPCEPRTWRVSVTYRF